MSELRKLQHNKSGCYMITLPTSYCKELGLSKRDIVRMDMNESKQIVLEKVNL